MAHVRRHPENPGSWQVRYRDPSGRERSKNFPRKADAEKFKATVTADVLRGDYIDPSAGRTTVAEFAGRWSGTREHLAKATRDHDKSILNSLVLPVFGSRPVASLRPSELSAWASSLTVSSSTKSKAIQKLSAVLKLAVADGAIKSNPLDGVTRPVVTAREGRALSDSEISSVLEAAEHVDQGTAAMVWLMVRAGLRVGEVLALQRGDLDGHMLTIRASLSRKEGLRPVKGRGGKGRTIPLPGDVTDRLRIHLAGTVVPMSGRMFSSPRGGELRYDNWRVRVWERIEAAAGIGEVRPHDLRHTTATRLFIVDKWTVPQVQAYMGHVDPKVTLRIYTHVRAEELPEPSDGQFADSLTA